MTVYQKQLGVLLFCISFQMVAQLDVSSRFENIDNGFEFYADNNEAVPVSMRVNFKLKNLSSSEGNNKIFILPAATKNIKLTTLTREKKGKYTVSASTQFQYGNHYLTDYDVNYPYYLPFKEGEAYLLSQGYNGTISHHNENALDFTMPVGTPILAARGGLVYQIEDTNSKSCPSPSCEKYNNKIIIYHNDGTFAEYTHIKRKGAQVQVGDLVKKGDLIALSGNVGWSTGPHLHFVVFIQQLEGRKTLETKFKINNTTAPQLLTAKTTYKRTYN
ncbi:M23 family metallopeptidase [Bizionia sediminis]|uniref:M23 family metallopeptidase n=1 Tax=Bizionia sediminis TaxID=1737064 RepID=A0ABW5KUR7_9FLAO